MRRHFVQFCPGMSLEPIHCWDVEAAKKMAKQKSGVTPYGFRFLTRSRSDYDLDSIVTDMSHMYYLGGKVESLESVKAHEPAKSILVDNMEINGWKRVIVTSYGFGFTVPFHDGDMVLGWSR